MFLSIFIFIVFVFKGLCVGDVSHQRTGLPDQQGVREVQQVPAQCQGAYLFLQYYTAEVPRYPVLHIVGYFYTFARISGHVALNPVCNKGSI